MTVPASLSFLDHTADVGIALDARSPHVLFHHAALGMLALLRGHDDADPARLHADTARPHAGAAGEESGAGRPRGEEDIIELAVTGAGWEEVMAAWLRELLFLHGTEHRDYVDSDFQRLEPTSLRARVRTEPAAPAVREIKGVTYHGLVVERGGAGWRAQVIFDV